MVSAEDVLIIFNAKDNVTATTKKLSSSMNGIKLGAGVALSAASAYMAGFAKDAISSAMTSQTEWARFGAAVTSTGGNWSAQSSSIKDWVGNFSNSMGRATADTREAATTLMNYGMSWNETKGSMGAVAGLAAKTGKSEADSSKMIISALNGRGMALEKATGLEIDNYKAADGTIDRAKLLKAITDNTKPAADAFKNTDAAKMQQLSNILKSLKTQFGTALLGAIRPLIPVVTQLFGAFNKLPGPAKSLIFVGAGLVTMFGLIAGPAMSVISLLQMMGVTLPAITGEFGLLASVKTALVGADAAEISAEVGAAAAHANCGIAVGVEKQGLIGLLASKASDLASTIANTASKVAAAAASVALATAHGVQAAATWVVTAAQAALNAVMMANPIILVVIAVVALAAGLYLLYTHVKPVRDAINGFLSMLSGAGGAIGGGIMSALTSLGNGFKNFVTKVGTSLMQLPGKIWQWLLKAGQKITQWNTKIRATLLKIGGNIVNNIINGVKQLPGKLWTWFVTTSIKILMFGVQALARARQAGQNILIGVINFVMQLPGQVANFLANAVGRILSFASQALSNAGAVGQATITGVIQFVSQIPQKVYNEFIKIGQKIHDSVANAVSAATSFGSDIVNAVMNALHIASPGIIQRKIAQEFMAIPGRINESAGTAYTAAQNYGKGIVSGFGNPTLKVGAQLNNGFNGVNSSQALLKKQQGINGSSTAMGDYTPTNNNNSLTKINISEGALKVDGASLTTKQSKQIFINALEGVSGISKVVTR